MSNQNIDISLKNVVGKCDLKCSYAFKYTESNTTAKNNGVVINLTYDNRSIPPVTYNGEKYQVSNISIVSPSIHNFNGSLMPGEILIEHVPIKGGNKLQVCIPFSSSSESSTASNILTEIINKVAANAPRQGDSTNLNISNFNLQNIIPKKPFFLYSNNTDDYLVFGSIDAIPLSSSTITTLQKIIKQFSLPTPGNNLFYNSKGPISGLQIGKDGIYISCQPTGSSTEETAITYDINSSSVDFSNVINSPIFQTFILIIIGCILFIIVFYGLSSFYNYISKDNIKLPNLPGIPKMN
jgi:carbonic anhydrase